MAAEPQYTTDKEALQLLNSLPDGYRPKEGETIVGIVNGKKCSITFQHDASHPLSGWDR